VYSATLVERGSIGRDPVAAQRHLIIIKKKSATAAIGPRLSRAGRTAICVNGGAADGSIAYEAFANAVKGRRAAISS